jgi:arylsulfatase A-like enzyme
MQARWASRWLERQGGRPFLLWVHVYDPHEPYAPPREYLRLAKLVDRYGPAFGWVGHVRTGSVVLDGSQRTWVRSLYGAEVRYVDDSLGLMLDTLERRGLFQDSLLIVTADHGEELWDHDSLGHGHALHEEIVRVPLLVKLPGATSGAVIEQRVSTGSLAPTVLDLCGLPRGTFQTTAPSLAPLLAGQSEDPERPVFVSGRLFYGPQEAVLFDRWKYEFSPLDEGERLYDLQEDPAERVSRSASEPAAVVRARHLLEEHQRRAEMMAARIGREGLLDLDEETREGLRSLGYIH